MMDLPSRLSFLFGSEEYVKMRRQLVLLREELMLYRSSELRFMCSGSLGEGVAYPGSDDDVMIFVPYTRVVPTFREATHRYDLLMIPSEYSAGYCLLLDINQSYSDVHIMNDKPFLSSSAWKQKGLIEGQYIHGPCQSQKLRYYEYDHAHCVICPIWPEVASEWITRNRSPGWPSPGMIQTIVGRGCHVVPIGDADSPLCQHEWRISFSMAERKLMHSFNHAQFLTYNLLRLALKRVIEMRAPGLLCSYFMKTTLFYTSERLFSVCCQLHNIETCFKACICVLNDFVYDRYFPNYFMPQYNMIKRKVNHGNYLQLLDILRTLNTIGIVGTMHLCGELSCLSKRLTLPRVEYKLDLEFMRSLQVEVTFHNIRCILQKPLHEQLESFVTSFSTSLSKILCVLLGHSPPLGSFLFQRGLLHCCQRMMGSVRSCLRMNKSSYRIHKMIGALLKMGYRADVSTGKLTIATYMYMVGRTESALSHIRQMLSHYPPYVIDGSPDDIKRTTYMDIICNRGHTMDYKVRHTYAPFFLLDFEALNVFPLPLRIWISTSEYINIHPLCYSSVLESLCYIRQEDNSSLKKSTRFLVNGMNDLKDNDDIAHTRLCVGIIKYVHGDSQSACRWLGSAYIMKEDISAIYNERFPRSAFTYIACLLNHRFNR